jgi:hypothetical protein
VRYWRETAGRWALGWKVASLIGICTVCALAPAGTTVYRCVKDGQTILADRPCDGNPPDKSSAGAPNSTTPAAIVPSSSSPSPVGKWAGQVQYQAIENGQVVQEAHSVVLLSAEFTLDGKIVATSADNGCQLLGIWSEDAQHMVWLDVTLNTCRYGSLNRRFGGSFLMAKPDSSGQLQIIATELPHVGQGARENDVKGTLRR